MKEPGNCAETITFAKISGMRFCATDMQTIHDLQGRRILWDCADVMDGRVKSKTHLLQVGGAAKLSFLCILCHVCVSYGGCKNPNV